MNLDFTVMNYKLDNDQLEIVKDDNKYLFVLAGAGSGKTLTILGKIKYLIEEKHIPKEEIVCITFTNMAVENLKRKIREEINDNIECYTFHKLAMKILDETNYTYEIASDELLTMVVENFFNIDILSSPNLLKVVLRYFNIYFSKDYYKSYQKILVTKSKEILLLKRQIMTFICLFKCGNYKMEDYQKFFKKIKSYLLPITYLKEKYFLLLTLNIYLLYEKEKKENKELDFDDLLFIAKDRVKYYKRKISYIIIDEYQDTSYVRFLFIKELVDNMNSSLMVVGDDFQSIYRFSGCDISLFYNFKDYYKEAVTHKIRNTYRNSEELIKIASEFILKNKYQLRKELTSFKHIDYPLQVIYSNDLKSTILKVLDKLDKGSIFILGRNNNDINLILSGLLVVDNDKIVYKKRKDLVINYLTIHKSKGLEADNVIVINFFNSVLGFPNQIKEERIMRLVTKKAEDYPYSEERRLFYVAITRTRNRCYLLVPSNNYSIFIKELERKKSLVKFVRMR